MLQHFPTDSDRQAGARYAGGKPIQFRLKHVLILITVLVCGLAFLRAVYIDLTYVETGENVEYVKWLPKSASNVSYYRSYSFTAYEFDISEADFLAWSFWKMQPITKPVSVIRYSYTNHPPYLSQTPTSEELEQWYSQCHATVSNGWWYERRQSNGGGVSVAYDRKKGRAFVQTSPR
jgi:hypothetical protein